MKSLFCFLIGGGYTDENSDPSKKSENSWLGFERKVPPRRPDQRLNMLKVFSHQWAEKYLEDGCQFTGGCQRPHPRNWLNFSSPSCSRRETDIKLVYKHNLVKVY